MMAEATPLEVMQLPDASGAYIPPEKLHDYLLFVTAYPLRR